MERPPRVGLKLLLRAGLGALLVVVLSATAVATTVIRDVVKLQEEFIPPGRAVYDIPEITKADAGGPRTIMILGSDKREGVDKDSPPRSDTILLVRADPDKDAIAVMSIPRDLSVHIPGVGKSKINYAFEKGRARLVVRTVKKLFGDATGDDFAINNVMVMDYGGFRRAVDYIGGVYVDIDRRYYNDNSSGENYATIDIEPGYRKLRGRDALDYVRYRHTDNDFVRAARQQDFLRQARNAAGVRSLISVDDRHRLARVFGRYFTVDRSFTSTQELFSMIRLGIFLARENLSVNEVRFRAEEAENPQLDSNLYSSKGDLRRTLREFMNAEGSQRPRQEAATPAAEEDRESARERRKRERRREPVAGMEDASVDGENFAVLADPRLDFPFYFPELKVGGSVYEGTEPELYRLRDERGKRHDAYRLVLRAPGIGNYYGVQGMTWKAPPILDNPDRSLERDGRTFQLYYDGSRVRLVAWHTKRGVYWVSNTLTRSLSRAEMLEIAASLRRLNQ
jgi:LCP family protein required for cell wall assembly